MLQTGHNLTQADDLLQKISVLQVFNIIKNAPPDLISKIIQLRMVLSLDPARYRQLKTTLPYFTCGIFHPPYRKSGNFGFIEHFVLDFDNLRENEVSAERLRNMLTHDERVEMLFTSPSGNGIKAMLRLSERCYDRVKFSMFYKIFVLSFSAEFGITKVADSKTSDVTRACFLSSDENAFYNPGALQIKMDAYIDFDSPEQIIETNLFLKEQNRKFAEDSKEDIKDELSPEILNQIRKKLKPDTKLRHEKIIYVPEELENIISKVKEKMTGLGIDIRSVENIHYGKKFVFSVGEIWAEVNVFYGKRGFSVVKTPKRGSNEELANISQRVLCELLIR